MLVLITYTYQCFIWCVCSVRYRPWYPLWYLDRPFICLVSCGSYGPCKCSCFVVLYHSYAATLVFTLLCTKFFSPTWMPACPNGSWCRWQDELRCWLPKPYLQHGFSHGITFILYVLSSVISCAELFVFKPLKIYYIIYSNIQFAEILCSFVPAYTWRRRAWRLC
jgi:hypothetical protein